MFNDVIGFTLDSLYIDFANPFFLIGCATASYGLLVPYLCVCVCVCVCVTQSCPDSVRPHGLCMDSPGKNTGVGCLSLLQGIFLTQGFLTRDQACALSSGTEET